MKREVVSIKYQVSSKKPQTTNSVVPLAGGYLRERRGQGDDNENHKPFQTPYNAPPLLHFN